MSTATITRIATGKIDGGKTGTDRIGTETIDWLARADRIAGEIAEAAARHDADDSFVSEGYRLLKEEGFFKALVPAELGGGGAEYTEICHAIRRIAASCGATALAFSMHSHLVAAAAWRWRHQNAPTEGLLKRVAAEDLILVSSGGSDWLKSAGIATKTEGGYLINARKIFSSGCPAGDLLVTSAVFDDPEGGPTVLHFAVPLKGEGVTILDTWHVLGMRGSGSHDVELKNVFLPDAAMPGPETTNRAVVARTLAGQAAIRTVERAMEVAGGASFYRRVGLERAFRDIQGARFHPLQEKAQWRYTGRLALGLDIDG